MKECCRKDCTGSVRDYEPRPVQGDHLRAYDYYRRGVTSIVVGGTTIGGTGLFRYPHGPGDGLARPAQVWRGAVLDTTSRGFLVNSDSRIAAVTVSWIKYFELQLFLSSIYGDFCCGSERLLSDQAGSAPTVRGGVRR